MPIKPTREIVIPPKDAGGEWFTFVVNDDDHPTQDENRERRRLGLPLRAVLPPERTAAIQRGPKYQIPPTHLPPEQMEVWNDCVRLLNRAIAISREQEGPGTMYCGLVASRAWAVHFVEDLTVQSVRWVECDLCPAGVNPMHVLLEAEAQLRDIVENPDAPATPEDKKRVWAAKNPFEANREELPRQLARIEKLEQDIARQLERRNNAALQQAATSEAL
jgi:hypothetical protein